MLLEGPLRVAAEKTIRNPEPFVYMVTTIHKNTATSSEYISVPKKFTK